MKRQEKAGGRRIKLPFSSIRTNMLAVFSVLIVATLTFFYIISLNYTERTILNNSIDYTTRLTGQVTRDIDSYIDYMENISSMVAHSSDVQNYLLDKKICGRSQPVPEDCDPVFHGTGNTEGYFQYCRGFRRG